MKELNLPHDQPRGKYERVVKMVFRRMFSEYLNLLAEDAEKMAKERIQSGKKVSDGRSNKSAFKIKDSYLKGSRKASGHDNLSSFPILFRSGTLLEGIVFEVLEQEFAIDVKNVSKKRPKYKNVKTGKTWTSKKSASEYSEFLHTGKGQKRPRPHLLIPNPYQIDGKEEVRVFNKIFGVNLGKFFKQVGRAMGNE